MKISHVGYFTFYNKNELHCKDKVIVFFISQDKFYWLNVSISFDFFVKIKHPLVGDREKPAQFLGWRGGRIRYYYIYPHRGT